MLGTAGNDGDVQAKDPVDRVSSRVQAVACFFPPTDFLNYGKTGDAKIHATDHAPPYRAAFDYRELDKESRLWVSITDFKRLEEIAREISPVSHVTPTTRPRSLSMAIKTALSPSSNPSSLLRSSRRQVWQRISSSRKAHGHGWLGLDKDESQLIDWFDKYLKKAG